MLEPTHVLPVRLRRIYGTAFDEPDTPIFDRVRSSIGLPLDDQRWRSCQPAPGRRREPRAGLAGDRPDRSAEPGRHDALRTARELLRTTALTPELLERTLAGLHACISGDEAAVPGTGVIT